MPDVYTLDSLGCNARVTLYADGTVDNAVAASRNLWIAPGFTAADYKSVIDRLPADVYLQACHEHIPWQLRRRAKAVPATDCSPAEQQRRAAESLKRSRRRAIESVYEYIRNNPDLDTFCTLTLAHDRRDFDTLAKALKERLGKWVQRRGLKYVAVYEYHKDGALHVHMLCNHDALTLVPAVNPHTGRQVRHRDKHGHWHAIYNLPEWRLGYTTAQKCYGNRIAIAKYVTKYVTKSECKIGGRWYMHSHNINRPEHRYYQVCYNDIIGRIVRTPEAAHLTIKRTTPEQIALHIDKERDIHYAFDSDICRHNRGASNRLVAAATRCSSSASVDISSAAASPGYAAADSQADTA